MACAWVLVAAARVSFWVRKKKHDWNLRISSAARGRISDDRFDGDTVPPPRGNRVRITADPQRVEEGYCLVFPWLYGVISVLANAVNTYNCG